MRGGREEAEAELLSSAAHHREQREPAPGPGRLDLDQVVLVQVTPWRGVEEPPRRVGKGGQPGGCDAGFLQRAGDRRLLRHCVGHRAGERSDGGEFVNHLERQAQVGERFAQRVRKMRIDADRARPVAGELRRRPHFGKRRQRGLVLGCLAQHFHVCELASGARPYRRPRSIWIAAGRIHPGGQRDDCALPDVLALREAFESGQLALEVGGRRHGDRRESYRTCSGNPRVRAASVGVDVAPTARALLCERIANREPTLDDLTVVQVLGVQDAALPFQGGG